MKPTKSVETMTPGDLTLFKRNYKNYLDENNIIKTYARKERKNFSLYDVHKIRKEEFEENQEKECIYKNNSLRNNNRNLDINHLLNGVNIYKLNPNNFKDIRLADYMKDLSQKIILKKKNSIENLKVSSPLKNNTREKGTSCNTVSYKKSHLDLKIKQLYFDLKELEDESSKKININNKSDKPYMMVSRYLIFTQNLLSNSNSSSNRDSLGSYNIQPPSSSPLLKKSIYSHSSSNLNINLNLDQNKNIFTEEMDYFNLYTKALKESVKQIIKSHKNNPSNNGNKNFKNMSKIYLSEIGPNSHLEEIMDKVYRNIIYTTEKNQTVSEDKVLNLISQELTFYLSNKIKIHEEGDTYTQGFDSNLKVKGLNFHKSFSQKNNVYLSSSGKLNKHNKNGSVDLPNIKSAIINIEKNYYTGVGIGNSVGSNTQNSKDVFIQKTATDLTSINENKESESHYVTSDNTTFENIGKNIENQIKQNRERKNKDIKARKNDKIVLEYNSGKLYPVLIKEKSFDIFGREITVNSASNERIDHSGGDILEDNIEESVSLQDENVSEEEYSDKEVSFSEDNKVATKKIKKKIKGDKGVDNHIDENRNVMYTGSCSTDKNATNESIFRKTKDIQSKDFFIDKNHIENLKSKKMNCNDDVNIKITEDLQNTFIDNKIKNSNFKLTLSNFNSRKVSRDNSKKNSKDNSKIDNFLDSGGDIKEERGILGKNSNSENKTNSKGDSKSDSKSISKNKMSNSSNIKISISKDRKGNIHASNNFNNSKSSKSKETDNSHSNDNEGYNNKSHSNKNINFENSDIKDKINQIENKPVEKENILSDLFKRKSQEERRKESEISDTCLAGRETNDNSPLINPKRNVCMLPSPLRNSSNLNMDNKLSVYADFKNIKNTKSNSITSSNSSTINTSQIKTKTKNSKSSIDRENYDDDSVNLAVKIKNNSKSKNKNPSLLGNSNNSTTTKIPLSGINNPRHKSTGISSSTKLNLNSVVKKGNKAGSVMYSSSSRKTHFNAPVVLEQNEENNQLTFEADDSEENEIFELEVLSSSTRRNRAKTTYVNNQSDNNDNNLNDRMKNNSVGFKKNSLPVRLGGRRTAIAFDKQREIDKEKNLKIGTNINEYVNSLEKNISDSEEEKKEVKKELDLVSILAARNMKRFSQVQTTEQMLNNVDKALELKKLVEKSQQKEEKVAEDNMKLLLEAIQKNEKKASLLNAGEKSRPSQFKPKKKKGARKTVTDEEKREFHEKMMKINEIECIENDEEMQEGLQKKKLCFLYNLDQDLNYLMQKSDSERKRYEDIKEKLDSLKNFDSASYVEFLEKNYKNIKNEMEVRKINYN